MSHTGRRQKRSAEEVLSELARQAVSSRSQGSDDSYAGCLCFPADSYVDRVLI